jgi:hypothetical protein
MSIKIGEEFFQSSSDGTYDPFVPSGADTPKWIKFVMKAIKERRNRENENRESSTPAFKCPQ